MSDTSPPPPAARRVLATRNASWARALARRLTARGVKPNTVSVIGIVFAAGAALAFTMAPGGRGAAAWLVAAAACIQLRLLCNLLDGMLAIEGGLKSRTGEIYNEFPDRLADILILVGAGYSLREAPSGPALGWLAAVLALLTAYIRVLSGSLGLPQRFLGPMAKQHRMFVLTLASLVAAVEAQFSAAPRALWAGLAIIVLGSAVTAWRRTVHLLRDADAR
jgi:phosphatidylglycerophosphate synthase